MLTQSKLKELLHYNPDTGIFTRIKSGVIAGSTGKNNYVCIGVKYKIYKAHRLAFLYITGHWPIYDVDHIDGNQSNNKWLNLRDTETIINCQNRRKPQKNSTSCGILGVSKRGNRYIARITINKKTFHLGCFSSSEEAYQAYLNSKRINHKGCTI